MHGLNTSERVWRGSRGWLIALAALFCMSMAAIAASPWWTNVLNSSGATNDSVAANQGQVKWFAVQAHDYLNAAIPDLGGAGGSLDALIESFSPTNNYLAVNHGQLKQLATPFYDRLATLGYATTYPWTATISDDRDFAVANIGQVKQLFDFDLAADTDADGMPDMWEQANFGSITNTPGGDFEGDGVNNLTEFLQGRDPTRAATTAPQEDVLLVLFTLLE